MQCQEQNSITKLSEGNYTEKLRQIFTKPVNVSPPVVTSGFPWIANGRLLVAGDVCVAKFKNPNDCAHASKSATNHHELMLVLAVIHERIRTGRAWYDGTEADVVLWQRVKELLK
jgi:hypothetical protein